MFSIRQREIDPQVLVSRKRSNNDKTFSKRTLNGTAWRVFPRNQKDVFAIQMLALHCEKFAPVFGEGVIISNDAIQKFDR